MMTTNLVPNIHSSEKYLLHDTYHGLDTIIVTVITIVYQIGMLLASREAQEEMESKLVKK